MQCNSVLSWAAQMLQTEAGDDRRSLDLIGTAGKFWGSSAQQSLHQNNLDTGPQCWWRGVVVTLE